MTTATAVEKPKRIQRKRTRGWTTSPNTVYVGRPTIFGNPFVIDDEHDAAWTVRMFRSWLSGAPNTGGGLRRISLLSRLSELRGKDLACWCREPEPGKPDMCHAAILLELANQ
jgi:hypothetical protein